MFEFNLTSEINNKTEVNLAIIGSREFNDYELLTKIMKPLLQILSQKQITFISGGAIGADLLGEKWADEMGISKKIFKADWDNLENSVENPCKIKYNKFGKPYNCLAGFNRNKDIIRNADIIFAFWDGKSKGTLDSLTLAKNEKKETFIVDYLKEKIWKVN